jgi:hypothetical protein
MCIPVLRKNQGELSHHATVDMESRGELFVTVIEVVSWLVGGSFSEIWGNFGSWRVALKGLGHIASTQTNSYRENNDGGGKEKKRKDNADLVGTSTSNTMPLECIEIYIAHTQVVVS